jgi:carboxylesterase 2
MVFTCTTSTLSTYLALNGYATYRYRYDASFPTTSIFANAGAYHTSEIPEVFGTYPLSNQFGTATQQQIQLSGFMQNVWANFAKNADAGVGWPKIGSALGNELGVLGASGSSGVTVRNTAVADYPCGLYLGLEGALALSY